MTSYITITDAETDPSAPLTSELAKKWRDNPIAIAEGSAGAPSVLGNIAVNTVAGGIGSYVFAKGTVDTAYGSTVAGSTLQPTSAAYSVAVSSGTAAVFTLGAVLTGTWRCMGTFDLSASYGGGGSNLGATLWLRIA